MKKPKLLTNLMGGEKRRHHVTAFITQEGDWNRQEPNTGFARVFIAMLILHVFIIGGIILSDFRGSSKPVPRAPAVTAAMLTKSSAELSASHTPPAASPGSSDDANYEKYTVASGDSLPTIVARFGVDKDEFVQLNHLDQGGGFSAGTVLLIPNRKVAEPMLITAARTMPEIGVKPPSDDAPATTSATTTDAAGTPPPADDAAAVAAAAPDSASTSSSTSGTDTAAPASAADSTTALVPLPEMPADSVAVQEHTQADAPPETAKPVESKTDTVAKEPARQKNTSKKVATAAPAPKPVPPPSEMKSRPITKADSPPKAQNKTSPAKAAGGTHVLAKGETLYRLSGMYGVSVESLMKANNVKDAAKLRDGTKLIIPAKK
ncbi:MAG: LysM peptidoglycan-binding domain-containing protein [Verrucomicrobiaceae bacterium]|nr:LysM peptidoglycan-binding domain-containing protein [Verrucomicrobiaceae bacterium]